MRALFLDRDGVINVDYGHVFRPSEFVLMPNIVDLCLKAQQFDFRLIVLTNQAGIAKGLYSEADFLHLSFWMRSRFAEYGVHFDEIYFCPHHPDFTGPCECRKPNPGLIFQAVEEFYLDLNQCALVGDKLSDIEAANRAKVGLPILLSQTHSNACCTLLEVTANFTKFAATTQLP